MDWIEGEAVWLFFPDAANVFVGRKTTQCLELTTKVVGGDEVGQVTTQLVMGFVVVAFDGRFLECTVHQLALTIGPRGVGSGQAVLNAVCSTDFVGGMDTMAGDIAVADARQVGGLETVICQHNVNSVR